ncbi:MAG: hypothetical protein COA52_11335 [Hyphomicrobiales bacterium]|nr:MAG: hypothetical protein COA52_11335 [Hyphomicrobiales bacterium]
MEQGTSGASTFGGGTGGQAKLTTTVGVGEGGSGGGGGGLGAGGAVFVRTGGKLNINYTQNSEYTTNTVTGGAGGLGSDLAGLQSNYNGTSGQRRGEAYFLDGNRARIDIGTDFTVTYDETIDDAREIGRAGGVDKYNCGTMQYGNGSGTLVMPYGGDTDIYEGEFRVRSDARLLYSETNVGVSGGTNNCSDSPILTGTGTLADTNILDGGVHNAGDASGDIGTMTIVGDYSIASGGTLYIDAGPNSASDRIVVVDRDFVDTAHNGHPLPQGLSSTSASDEASIVVIDPGSILRVMFQAGTYNDGDEWLLIDNKESDKVTSDSGGTTDILASDPLGGFASISHNLGFGIVTVETNGFAANSSFRDGNNVVLKFDTGFNCDLTFNENSTLGGSVTLDNNGDVSVSFNGLNPEDLKCPTLDTMSGEGHVSAAAMLLERSMALTGSIATRVAASWMQDGPAITGVRASQWLATWKRAEEVSNEMDRIDSGKEPLPRSADYEANPEQYPEDWGPPLEEPEKTTVWGRMLGDGRWVKGDGNAADSSRYGAGLMVGADRKMSEHTRLGIAVGVGRDWFNVEERRRTDITVDSISGSLYGSYTKGAWQSMLVGSVAHQMWDTKRHILFPDVASPPIDRTATAEYDAFYWAIRGELGYLHVTDNNWLIRPSVTARWAQLHTGAFHEEGAGDINLISNGAVFRSIQTSLGIRASKEKQLDNGWMRTFQIKGEWLHQWSDNYQEAAFAFEGTGNTREEFDIRSAEESPASALLGIGVSFTNDNGLTGFLTGDAILSPTTFHPSVAAGVKLRF